MALYSAILLFLCFRLSLGWQEEELELFDLVEDIGENFYDLLEVSQDATAAEIRRSYRRLSLKYHPDKSSAPDAAEKFRIINTVAEVLRDDLKRSIYDEILVEGLPDWRQPVYYYRRARRMTIYELSFLVLVVATIGQFLIGWAQYFEKWLVLQELLERKAKRESKGSRSHKTYSPQLDVEVMYYQQMAKDSIPRCSNLLPVVILKKLFQLSLLLYHTLRHRYWERTQSQDAAKEASLKQKMQNGSNSRGGGKRGAGKRGSKSRKLQRDDPHTAMSKDKEEGQKMMYRNDNQKTCEEEEQVTKADSIQGGTALQNICPPQEVIVVPTKAQYQYYPTTSRERIDRAASAWGRSPATHPSQGDSGKLVIENSGSWSQYQQRQLEWALSNYSQRSSEQRWSLVAKAVPGKTKEECVARYRQLVELVRKRRQN